MMSDMREAFEKHADQYDNFGDEWQDMGVDQHFYAGWKAALEHAGQTPAPSVTKLLEHQHDTERGKAYKAGWNDCRNEMLNAAPEATDQ